MTHPIYTSPTGKVPRWEISYYNETDPSLIRFVKYGRTTKLLDQVARWRGNRWDPARWCPDGKVPKDVMRQVVGELLRREVTE